MPASAPPDLVSLLGPLLAGLFGAGGIVALYKTMTDNSARFRDSLLARVSVLETKITEIERENDALVVANADMKADLKVTQAELAAVHKQLDAVTKENVELRRENRQLRTRLDAIEGGPHGR